MTRSLEQIWKEHGSVPKLRTEAARIKRENNLTDPIMRDGLEIEISKGRKQELIEYISQLEQLAAKPVTAQTEDVTTPQTVAVLEDTTTPQKELQIDKDSDYTESEQEKLFVAKQLYTATEKDKDYTGLKEYHLNFCKSKKLFSSENFSKFAQLVAKSRVLIEGYADSKSPNGKASPGGLQAIRVQIMKYLKELCEQDKNLFEPVLDRTLMDTYSDFDNAVRGAFQDISKIKYELYKQKRDSGEKDVRTIKVTNLINWAKETVSNLSDNSAQWKDVCIAIMLLTGRRQSEVMSSGIFEYIDDSHLMFEGQLKRHTDEIVEATQIPVIGGMANQVVAAINWLEEYDKRTLPINREKEAIQKAASKSHNRCSRYISETMSKLELKVEITNGKSWLDSKGNNVFKGHLTRQIYAQICAELFAPDTQKKHSYIADILLESRDAAPSYDRDIEIIDIDKIN